MRADDVAGRMRIRAARDHVLHANSPLVDRVDLTTPLSLSSQLATGLSALAPEQRAGAQRLRALSQNAVYLLTLLPLPEHRGRHRNYWSASTVAIDPEPT